MKTIFFTAMFTASLAIAAPGIRYVQPDAATGRSLAVVVDDQPLAHTGQVFGASVDEVLESLGQLLQSAGSDFAHIVRLNLYFSDPAIAQGLPKALRRFPGGSLPAVTVVGGAVAKTGAAVAADAVATVANTKLAASNSGVAILPAGGAAYISGQAEKGADLAEATRKTMDSLGETLKFLGLGWKDAVQLKAFVSPMSEAEMVLAEMRKFAVNGQALPILLVEWQGGGVPIEIELIASAATGSAPGSAEYLTPPALKASPVYSRVVRFGAGPRIYFSGLHASTDGDAAAQVRDIFGQLQKGLDQAQSDLRHLVKATYYVASDAISKALNDVRPEYYDPARPPAASKAMVNSVAAEKATFTMDMIAVPTR